MKSGIGVIENISFPGKDPALTYDAVVVGAGQMLSSLCMAALGNSLTGLEFAYGILLTAVCLLFAQPIIRLFATDPAVVDLGVRFLRTSALFYMLPAATNGIQGFFRGMGDLKVTLNSSMLNMGGRVAAAALFVLVMKMDIEALPFSYAVGWLLMLLYELPMLVRFLRSSEM